MITPIEIPKRAQKWKADQLPYPKDADYIGAKGGFFDPSEDAEIIICGGTIWYALTPRVKGVPQQ